MDPEMLALVVLGLLVPVVMILRRDSNRQQAFMASLVSGWSTTWRNTARMTLSTVPKKSPLCSSCPRILWTWRSYTMASFLPLVLECLNTLRTIG